MFGTDGSLCAFKEDNNLVHLDLAVLKQIDINPICDLYWNNDMEITLEKELVIDLYLTMGLDFAPGVMRRLRYFPTPEIRFVSLNGAPGWFRMYEPK